MLDPRTIPADEMAALAVATPTFPELVDWLDGSRIPIEVAYGLDDVRLVAVVTQLSRQLHLTEAIRLAVGAALHKRRDDYKRGEWLPYVAALADTVGLKTATLGRWMADAERAYGLALPKAAKPTRRKPVVRVDVNSGAVSAADAGDIEGGDPTTDVAEPEPAGEMACDIGAKDFRPDATPARSPQVEVADALDLAARTILDVQGVELARWVAEHRTAARAAHGALDLALAATRPKAGSAPAPPPTTGAPCRHPKPKRKQLGYMTVCGTCGSAVKPGE